MKIYFVRHAQSEGNANGHLSTVNHDQLSLLGLEQAEALAVRLKDYTFDHVYVSSCGRTLQTIAPYLRDKGQTGEVWRSLVEGCWQAEIEAPIPDRSEEEPVPVPIPEGIGHYFSLTGENQWEPWSWETYQEGALRCIAAREELLKRHSNSEVKILIVGHYNSGSRLMELLMDLPHSRRFDQENTGFSCLRQNEDETFSVHFLNRM